MKTDQALQDMRSLEGDELANRLKLARRELYELRFKLAVGQLEDSSQIHKIRKDIARILTVIRQRELGEFGELGEAMAESDQQAPPTPPDISTAAGEAQVGAETESEETEEIGQVAGDEDHEEDDK